jgi:hypothetical protein
VTTTFTQADVLAGLVQFVRAGAGATTRWGALSIARRP